MNEALIEYVKDHPTPLAETLGIELDIVTPDLVTASMKVGHGLCTIPDILHGGAMMAFADNVGAVATFVNLPEGATTTTIESKTNFLAAIEEGDIATIRCEPIHRGRSTMVWQSKVYQGNGRLAAIIMQTQIVKHK